MKLNPITIFQLFILASTSKRFLITTKMESESEKGVKRNNKMAADNHNDYMATLKFKVSMLGIGIGNWRFGLGFFISD